MGIITEQSDSFEELLASYISGELDSIGKKRLLEMVLQDPQKAEEYRNLTRLQSQVRSNSDQLKSLRPSGSSQFKIVSFSNSFKYLSAAAVILVTIFGAYMLKNLLVDKTPIDVLTQSYGDCSSSGEKIKTGENISGKEIKSGKYSVCDVQLEGEQSITVRALPESDFTADRREKEIHLSLGYGSILVDSQRTKNSERVFITANDFKLTLDGSKVALNRPDADSLSVQVLEGRVKMESGGVVLWQSLSPLLDEDELALLAKEFPVLFTEQQVIIESGEQIVWKGLSPERVEGLRRIENSIKEARKSQPGIHVDQSLIKSLKPHIDSLPKDPFLISPKELKSSLKKILPDEKADLERRFATMVRFPPKDLREREVLMDLVKKTDKISIIELLKEKNQPQVIRILVLKDGTSERGYIYQEDNFYIILRPDGNLIIPVDSVEKIESE